MTQENKIALGQLLLAACDRVAKRENKKTAKGDFKPYTSYRLAKAVNINAAHAYRILHGENLPSRDLLLRICKVLDCNREEIAQIFNQTDYRMPTDEEIEETSSCAA
jgi:transcriptional regulator with XRE-family HTH domain